MRSQSQWRSKFFLEPNDSNYQSLTALRTRPLPPQSNSLVPSSSALTHVLEIGGSDGTRTRGLLRDRAATTCKLLDLNGTDSPFLIL